MKNVLFNMTSGDNSNDLPSEAENFQDPSIPFITANGSKRKAD